MAFRPCKVLALDKVPERIPVTLTHFKVLDSNKAETLSVSNTPVPQGLQPCRGWLVSLETADSHGVFDLAATLLD